MRSANPDVVFALRQIYKFPDFGPLCTTPFSQAKAFHVICIVFKECQSEQSFSCLQSSISIILRKCPDCTGKRSIYIQAFLAMTMRFQLWQCDFSFGNAFSSLAMRFQLWQCDFSFGNAFSALAMRFQL
jgi:hypothetical protein